MDSPYKGILNQEIEPYVTMRFGNRVNILNPKPNQIRIDDIAWFLANTCRYNSAINYFYSVAEHSFIGTYIATTVKVKRQFLIHDAAEYVFGDIASPVGRLCPDYKALCNSFQGFLNEHFTGESELDHEVHEIDTRLCATEMRCLRGQPDSDLCAEPYVGGVLWLL